MMLDEGEFSKEIIFERYKQENQDGLSEIQNGCFLAYLGTVSYFKFSDFFITASIFGLLFLLVITLISPIVRKKFTYPRLRIEPRRLKFMEQPVVVKILIFLSMIWIIAPFIFSYIPDVSYSGEYYFLSFGVYSLIYSFSYAMWLKIRRFYLSGCFMVLGSLLADGSLIFKLPPLITMIVPVTLGMILIGMGIVLILKFSQNHPKLGFICPHCKMPISNSIKSIEFCPHCGQKL